MALLTFNSLAAAKAAGYEPYDHARVVFLVSKKTEAGFELAAVQMHIAPHVENK